MRGSTGIYTVKRIHIHTVNILGLADPCDRTRSTSEHTRDSDVFDFEFREADPDSFVYCECAKNTSALKKVNATLYAGMGR